MSLELGQWSRPLGRVAEYLAEYPLLAPPRRLAAIRGFRYNESRFARETATMSRFRRVDGAQAGPDALGILVAPGARTLVILRPRALDFDLLPVLATTRHGLGNGFCDLERAGAMAMARALAAALEDCAAGGTGCVGPIPDAEGDGYWVQAEIAAFTLLVCRREPGRSYRAHVFATLEEARTTAAALRRVLCPPPEAAQELYFNMQNFTR